MSAALTPELAEASRESGDERRQHESGDDRRPRQRDQREKGTNGHEAEGGEHVHGGRPSRIIVGRQSRS